MATQRSSVSDRDRRELLALEKRVGNTAKKGGDLTVHLTYPNTYWVAMSNLGFQAVYHLFNEEKGVYVERAFLPEEAISETRDERKKDPSWRTFESARLLSECDILAFSLSFETDYPHLLRMLANANLLFNGAKARDDAQAESSFHMPLLIAGGTAVTLNPEPVAELLDVIVLGEAEELIPELTAAVRLSKSAGDSRIETLRKLSQLEGVYVPRFYQPTYNKNGTVAKFKNESDVPTRAARRFVKDISKFPTYSRVLTPETEFKSMFLTETGRGCEMGCRFCVAGYIYRPVRKRSEDSIADTIKIGLENSDAIGFVGASVSSHKSISKLASSVAQAGARASLSSLMSQKITKELAASLSESEYKTVALAPEAGNERLRRAAGKRVSDGEIVAAAVELAEAGIKGFKLYFIVGLPTETDDDTDSIARLSIAVRNAVVEASKQSGSVAWVQLSVNPFIPKASTPFQWEPMVERKLLEKKIDRLRNLIKRTPNLEMRFESPKESYFQALLSRGDRRVVHYLLAAETQKKDWKWLMQNKHTDLKDFVPPISFYTERRIPYSEKLPWEIVDSRIEKGLLYREAMRARHGEEFGKSPNERELPREDVFTQLQA